MTIPIPHDVRQLLDAPNYVHLSTLRADGSPRNWVVWVGLEGDHILVCTSDAIWKAKDMRRHPRVAMSVTDKANPTTWPRSRAGWWKYLPTRTAATWTRSPSNTPASHSPAAGRTACAS
jgi:Pyridoxamine 5'-phosphate oxidase